MRSMRSAVKLGAGRVAGACFLLALVSAGVATGQTAAQRQALAKLAHRMDAVVSEGSNTALLKPAGLAYDASGDLFVADTDNNLVREINPLGIITTVAGTGEQGYAGDGAAATSALLDRPTGLAVDASGNLYIADSHNHAVRMVSAGVITTVAGTGAAGFSGDGAQATSAQLDTPTAVAVSASGTLYIADTLNFRIRSVVSGVISTVAGTGEQGYSGDGGPATLAQLDAPMGLAVDTAGNLYIADTHNNRVREVAAATNLITTLAGTGDFAFNGDGANAALAHPRGLSVDASGTVYLSDSDNQRVRSVSNGSVTTVAGDGEQGYDTNNTATSSSLNLPRAVAVASGGGVAFADTGNNAVQVVTSSGLGTIGGQGVSPDYILMGPLTTTVYGSGSLTATVNGGTQLATGQMSFRDGVGQSAPLIGSSSVSAGAAQVNLSHLTAGTHTVVATYGGDTTHAAVTSGQYILTVTQAPLTDVANGVTMLFGQTVPALTGSLSGVLAQDAGQVTALYSTAATSTSVPGTYPIAATLSGSAAANYSLSLGAGSGAVAISKAPSTLQLASSTASPISDTAFQLTATVASTTTGLPSGGVNFFNGATLLNASPIAVAANGQALLNVVNLPVGTMNLTAVYSGDVDFLTSTSAAVAGKVLSPEFSLATQNATPTTVSVIPGQNAQYALNVTPVNNVFVRDVTLTVSGLPSGAEAVFSPSTVTAGNGTQNVTLTVKTATLTARAKSHSSLAPLVLALLLLPLAGARRWRRMGRAWMLSLMLLLGGASLALTGCGGKMGYFNQQPVNYTLTVTASSGAVQHTTTLILNLQ